MVSVTVERLETPRGELVLRRDGPHHEIVSNGMFLMDTRDGRSERALVRAAAGPGDRVLIGGLGVGFSLAEALAVGAAAVTVVEIEPAVLRWNAEHLGTAALADPRVTVVLADLAGFLTRPGAYDAVCLDVDNGPEWTVTAANADLYGEAGLDAVDRVLAPGGRLAVWSAGAAPAFEARLRCRYAHVDRTAVPVPAASRTWCGSPTADRPGNTDRGVSPAPGRVVPAGEPPGRTRGVRHMTAVNSIGWFEVGTDDPAAAEKFYGDLFGWTAAAGPEPAYRILSTGDQELRGGLVDTGGRMPGYAVFTVLVEDVEATCRRAEAAGGTVQRGPEVNPAGVRFAHLLDPAGNHVGVFTPPAGRP